MEYMAVQAAAEMWRVSLRLVQRPCITGRVEYYYFNAQAENVVQTTAPYTAMLSAYSHFRIPCM